MKASSPKAIVSLPRLENMVVNLLSKKSSSVINDTMAYATTKLTKADYAAKDSFLKKVFTYINANPTSLTDKEKFQIANIIGMSYDIGIKNIMRDISVNYSTKLTDKPGQDWCKKDTLYWIGNYFSDTLGAEIKGVCEAAFSEGLGRAELGAALRDKFGQQIKRSDSYWKGLAATNINRARCFGGVTAMEAANVNEYEIIAMMDERTSPICRMMNGKIFTIKDAVKLRDAAISSKTPEEFKAAHPWIPYATAKSIPDDKLAASGLSLPPYHFYCRTTYAVSTFKVYDQGTDMIQAVSAEKSDTLPDNLNDLRYVGNGSYLGGVGKKNIYKDASGQEYIFKPAQSKNGVQEDFRAYVQKAASDISEELFGKNNYVPITVVRDKNGTLGTLQKLIQDTTGDVSKIGLENLTDDALRRIQREHVLDYAIGNYDAHAGNFVLDKNGKVWSVDKEQAFRYWKDSNSGNMSLTYHPNVTYGENPPIYNRLFSDFAQGKNDIRLQDTLPALQRLERIPDDKYRAILRPYAKALHGSKAEDFLDYAVKRKNSMRAEYEKFYTELMKKRYSGYKDKFKFADSTTTNAVNAVPAAAALTPDVCKAMKLSDLHDLAVKMKIPSSTNMNKQELIDAISGNKPIADVLADYKARRSAKRKSKTARASTAVISDDSRYNVADTDLYRSEMAGLTRRIDGHDIPLDSDKVEGQVAHARIYESGNQSYIQFNMKIREEYFQRIDEMMNKIEPRLKIESLNFRRNMAKDSFRADLKRDVRSIGTCRVAEVDGVKIRWVNQKSSMRAQQGYFELSVEGSNGTTAAQKIQKVLTDFNNEDLLAPRTAEDIKKYKAMRVIWQNDPRTAGSMSAGNTSYADIKKSLLKIGINEADLDKMVLREVSPGNMQYVWEGRSKEYIKAGVDHLFSGVGDGDNAVRFLTDSFSKPNGALKCTIDRLQEGTHGGGASESKDVKTGGAASVFTRIAPKSVIGKMKYKYSFKGEGYKIIFSPKVLDRTDWYAYRDDNFGNTSDSLMRHREPAIEHIQDLNDSYVCDNEVMFRSSLSVNEAIGIRCDGQLAKDVLIAEFKSRGIDKIHGVNIDKFIQVGETIGEYTK